MMGRGTAPCGHLGEVIVGTYVRCSACDGAKKPVTNDPWRIHAATFVSHVGERFYVERYGDCQDIFFRPRFSFELVRVHLINRDGDIVETLTDKCLLAPGDELRLRIHDRL